GDGTEAHGAGAEALDDLACRFHFFERNGRAGDTRIEVEQTAQRARVPSAAVHVLCELPISLGAAATRGNLQRENRLRVPGMPFAGAAPVELTRVRQRRGAILFVLGIAERMTPQRFLFEDAQADALQ